MRAIFASLLLLSTTLHGSPVQEFQNVYPNYKTLVTGVILDSKLDPVNCLEQEEISTQKLLDILPSGMLLWEEKVVDKVIGTGTFEAICKNISSLSLENSNSVFVTHSLQISAALQRANFPEKRLKTYGFVMMSNRPQVYEQGLFAAQ